MKTLITFVLLSLSTLSFSQTLLETIDLPAGTFYDYGYGLVYNNSNYWISSYSSSYPGIIKAVDATGTEVDQVTINYTTIRPSQGLTSDGTNFWFIERYGGGDFFKVAPNGTVLDSIISSQLFGGSWYIGGAGWDGTHLWVSVYYPNTDAALYKIDISTKTVVDTIPTYGTQPQGITFKGDTLFYDMDDNDGDDERVFAVDVTTKDTLFSFHVPDQSSQSPRGLAWDGTYFWLLAEPVGGSLNQRQLFKYDLGGSGTQQIYIPFSTLTYPNTTVGTDTSAIIQIFNVGTATLNVDSITVNNSVFSFLDPTAFTLTPGNNTDFRVVFTPLDYSFYQGLLKIYSDDPIKPVVEVDLQGQGVLDGAVIGLSSTSHNFGSVWVGTEGVTLWEFQIFNKGNQTLEISDMQFQLPEFYYNAPQIPFQILSTDTLTLTAYFYPTVAGNYNDTLSISTNDLANPISKISVEGTGVFNQYNYGYMFWQYQVPLNPYGGNTWRWVEGLKPINDITGDGIMDVVLSTDNGWTMCIDGAASGISFPLWSFNTHVDNNNSGSIGANGEYGVQDAIQIANDLNSDGKNDVVIATGGGNEHVYVLDGTNGEIIWKFGDEINYDLGDFSAVDVQRDFTGDQVDDVLAIADGNQTGTGYKRAFLFDGTDGTIKLEHFYPGPNPSFGKTIISINDISGDNLPDAVIAYGNNGSSNLSVRALNGANGNTIWTRDMVDWEPKELLELPLPGDSSDVIAAEYFSIVKRLNGRTGEVVWSYPLGGLSGVIQMSLIDDLNSDSVPDVLIASFAGNGLNCLSGADGAQLWAYPMAFQYGVAAVQDINSDGYEDVITGDQNGVFYCLSGISGSILFSQNFASERIQTVSALPSIDGNYSYELLAGTSNGNVVCFSGGTEPPVPVELVSFIATVEQTKVRLDWIVASQLNNSSFAVERKYKGKSFEEIAFVPGNGTTTELHSYSFIDREVQIGTYFYRLRQVDFDGNYNYSKIIEVEVGTPKDYALEQNYPNPFNPTTTIDFNIPATEFVNLTVYDILGNEITVLLNEEKPAGSYNVSFDASGLASGIYFYTLNTGQFISTKKMIFLK